MNFRFFLTHLLNGEVLRLRGRVARLWLGSGVVPQSFMVLVLSGRGYSSASGYHRIETAGKRQTRLKTLSSNMLRTQAENNVLRVNNEPDVTAVINKVLVGGCNSRVLFSYN